jgi:hypothetical protein
MECWNDGILGFCSALLKEIRSIKNIREEIVKIDSKTHAPDKKVIQLGPLFL